MGYYPRLWSCHCVLPPAARPDGRLQAVTNGHVLLTVFRGLSPMGVILPPRRGSVWCVTLPWGSLPPGCHPGLGSNHRHAVLQGQKFVSIRTTIVRFLVFSQRISAWLFSARSAFSNRRADGGHLDAFHSACPFWDGPISITADVCEAFWCVSCVLWFLNLNFRAFRTTIVHFLVFSQRISAWLFSARSAFSNRRADGGHTALRALIAYGQWLMVFAFSFRL